jgi:hypothetical protein
MKVRTEDNDAIRIDLNITLDEYYMPTNIANWGEGLKSGSLYLSLPIKLAKDLQTQLTKIINELPVKEEIK